MRNINTIAFLAMLLTAPGVFAQTCPFTTEFTVTLLPGIEGDFGIAETTGSDLNEAGEAVGSAFAEQPALAWRGVRWPVGSTEPQVLTDSMGSVNGIAENRHAAGEDVLGGRVWDADNAQALLAGLTGHLGAVGTDINSNGVIVGWSATAHDLFPAAWPDGVDGEPINLAEGVPQAYGGLMRTISERGVAVGEMSFFVAPFERAVVWDAASGAIRVLPGLRGFNRQEGSTTAVGVNTRGIVVGQSYRPLAGGAAAILPVSWIRGRVSPLPLGPFAGGTAYDINDCNTIVGEGVVNVFDFRAVIWQGGMVRQLDDLHAGPPLGLISAVAINNAGQILVNGGAQQTWIMTPVR